MSLYLSYHSTVILTQKQITQIACWVEIGRMVYQGLARPSCFWDGTPRKSRIAVTTAAVYMCPCVALQETCLSIPCVTMRKRLLHGTSKKRSRVLNNLTSSLSRWYTWRAYYRCWFCKMVTVETPVLSHMSEAIYVPLSAFMYQSCLLSFFRSFVVCLVCFLSFHL